MLFSETFDRYALLIGDGLCRDGELIAAIDSLHLQIQFESSGVFAIGEIRRNKPSIIFIDSHLSDISCEALTRSIRADENLSAISVICVLNREPDVSQIFHLLDAGADDCLSVFDDRSHIEAKLELIKKRRYSVAAVRRYYSELRDRHTQTLDFVRATTSLLESIDREFRSRGASRDGAGTGLLEEQLDMGLEIIRSLVSILDKEIVASDAGDLFNGFGMPEVRTGRASDLREWELNGLGLAS